MNQKKAKAIRKVAQSLTVGRLDVQYGRRMPVRLAENCTRAVYKQLKRTAY